MIKNRPPTCRKRSAASDSIEICSSRSTKATACLKMKRIQIDKDFLACYNVIKRIELEVSF